MSKGTESAIFGCLLIGGVFRLAFTWHRGFGYDDALGITLTSLALLGFIYLFTQRPNGNQL